MQAIARARFQRIATRKARVVLNMVRGKNVAVALDELRFTRKSAATIVQKALESAIANAQVKQPGIDLDMLRIETATADMAPNANMRRWRPRAMGRATMIKKGMSHITIIIGDGQGA